MCLQWIAEVLTIVSQQFDASIARVEGSKFVIAVAGLGPDQARTMAEAIRQSVSDLQIPIEQISSQKVLTVSIGGNVITAQPINRFSNLTAGAETALFSAKSLGNNQIFML